MDTIAEQDLRRAARHEAGHVVVVGAHYGLRLGAVVVPTVTTNIDERTWVGQTRFRGSKTLGPFPARSVLVWLVQLLS